MTPLTGEDAKLSRGAGAPSDDELWRLFASATTSEVFCKAWLALLCRQIPGIAAGVVLLEAEEANTFVPIAAWPEAAGDLSHLGKVAERALTDGRGVVERGAEVPARSIQVAYPIQVMQRTLGAVALNLAGSDNETAALRQLHWGVAWLRDLFLQRELQGTEARIARIGSVMEATATALRPGKLQKTLFEIANHVSRHLRCSRVGIGLAKGEAIQVAALSDAAWFEKRATVVKLYAAAMEEAFDRRATVRWSRPAGQQAGFGGPSSHALLAAETGAAEILSVPLLLGVNCVGALTLERGGQDGFTADELAWVEALAGLLPAIIDQKKRAERGYWAKLRDDVRALLTRLFGPQHLVWKAGATLVLLLALVLALVQIDYRVTAKTVIEGEVQRSIVAPFEGFIAASHVRAGDTVQAGQALCELDDRDLKVEQAKWTSEREQADRKLREAMAERDLSAVQIDTAQFKEAEAQLALATEKIERARLTAPFDGVVVSGDLSQLAGSPVEQGKQLFEVAPLESYRVILQVDEREIRHVEVGQQGKLIISGIAGNAAPFEVVKVTPVATAQDGRNFFRVEAHLQQAPPRLRPGMEGVGKIGVGRHRLWWVLTHTMFDWLRLQAWNWMP